MSMTQKLSKRGAFLAASLVLGAALVGPSLSAQTVTTPPVGAVTLSAPANSDSLYSIPLARDAIYTGIVSAVSGNTFTLSGASFTANALQYVAGSQPNTYYLQFSTGSATGQFSTVVSNASSSVTTEFEVDVLSQVSVGDQVVLRPYWTLATLFPSTAANVSFVPSTSNFPAGRRTEILFPDSVGVGINKSASAIYFYNSFWRKSGDTTPNRNDVVIPPDQFVIIRGNNSSTSTALTVVGSVQTYSNTVSLLRPATGSNDNPIALSVPVDVSLGNLNLISSGGPFLASTSNFPAGRGDEIIVYNNASIGKNKSASAIYFYNSFWRKSGDTSANQNNTTIPAGSAIIIRKKSSGASAVLDWRQPATVVSL